MTTRRTGIVAGIALAAGLAIGTVASASAANPSFDPGRHPMMGGSSFGPGMMGGSGMMDGLAPADREKFLQQCDEMHDAMLKALSGSPEPTATR